MKPTPSKTDKRARARAKLRDKLRQSRSKIAAPSVRGLSHSHLKNDGDNGVEDGEWGTSMYEESNDAMDANEDLDPTYHKGGSPLKRPRIDGPDDEVISITSSSESENLSNRPYDDGDSGYRASSSAKVTTAQPSTVVTRRMTRDGRAPRIDDTILEIVRTDQVRKKRESVVGTATKKARIKEETPVSEDNDGPENTDDDDDPPSPGRVFGSSHFKQSKGRGGCPVVNEFIDNAAEDEDDAGRPSKGSVSDESSDGYESSFIDDSPQQAQGNGQHASAVNPIGAKPRNTSTKAIIPSDVGAETPAQEDSVARSGYRKTSSKHASTLDSPFRFDPPAQRIEDKQRPIPRTPTIVSVDQTTPSTPKGQGRTSVATPPWPTPQTPGKGKAVSMRDMLGPTVSSSPIPSGSPVKKSVLVVDARVHQHCTTLPEHCEVSDIDSQDAFLAGDYFGLPALTRVSIVPWINTAGDGLVKFCGWGIWCPEMNGGTALNAVRFVSTPNDRFVNPSRASPVGVDCKETGTNRHSLMRGGKPLIAVITGFLQASNVITPSTVGLPQKQVSVAFHTQEWDRYLGFIGMATGKKTMWAQYRDDALQFSTRPVPDGSHRRGSASSASVLTAPSTPDAFALGHSDPIPVYDAREASTMDFNVDLARLDTVLPRWQGEIPYGSFVVVGHTIVVYYSKHKRWTLACNLQWIIVVGVPPESNTKAHLAHLRTDVVEDEDNNVY
ncbi:hypothetical protein MD484_g6885, partial [Candolleomyces efflorescens]